MKSRTYFIGLCVAALVAFWSTSCGDSKPSATKPFVVKFQALFPQNLPQNVHLNVETLVENAQGAVSYQWFVNGVEDTKMTTSAFKGVTPVFLATENICDKPFALKVVVTDASKKTATAENSAKISKTWCQLKHISNTDGPDFKAASVQVDRLGNVWSRGTETKIISVFDGENWSYLKPADLISGNIWSIWANPRQDEVWIGFDMGAQRININEMSVLKIPKPPPNNPIVSAITDAGNGNVVWGTWKGVFTLNPLSPGAYVSKKFDENTSSAGKVLALESTPDGKIQWFGFKGTPGVGSGLFVMHEGDVANSLNVDGAKWDSNGSNRNILSLAIDGAVVYAGLEYDPNKSEGGLVIIPVKKYNFVGGASALPTFKSPKFQVVKEVKSAFGLAVGANHELWVVDANTSATQMSKGKFTLKHFTPTGADFNGTWKTYDAASSVNTITGKQINNITFDQNSSSLWLSTEGDGLIRVRTDFL